MRALVLGAGFLGRRIASAIPGARLADCADITSRGSVQAAVVSNRAEVVINAAGKTGRPNVDECETIRKETYRANVVGALTVAEVCEDAGAHLVHLGSGCVFYGRSPHPDGAWRESDFPNPISFYSKSKAASDLVLAALPDVAVVRLRMPIDSAPHDRNLITKIARYPRVIAVVNSVTIVSDLLDVIRQIAERRLSGIFHATNPGVVSHRQILALYRELVDPSHTCEIISEEQLVSEGLALKTRSNCVLADERLAAAGIRMRPVEEALRDVMIEYANRSPRRAARS